MDAAELPPLIASRVEVIPETGCWEWLGSRTKGYGKIWDGSSQRTLRVHRVAYEALAGPIPEGLVLDHLCKNPPCCNPEHLEPVTQAVNTRRGSAPSSSNSGKTHCRRGHSYVEHGVPRRTGGRRCVQCHRDDAAAARAVLRPACGHRHHGVFEGRVHGWMARSKFPLVEDLEECDSVAPDGLTVLVRLSKAVSVHRGLRCHGGP